MGAPMMAPMPMGAPVNTMGTIIFVCYVFDSFLGCPPGYYVNKKGKMKPIKPKEMKKDLKKAKKHH